MQKSELSNINISDEQVLITPDELKVKLPLSEKRAVSFKNLAKPSPTSFTKKTIAYLSYVDHALSMTLKQQRITRSV